MPSRIRNIRRRALADVGFTLLLAACTPDEARIVAETIARNVEASSASWGATGDVNGYPCGGQLPSCRVLACESGGNPVAENPTSTASGLWQIIDGTWNGHGGYGHAAHAPVDVQNSKAAQLWAGGAGAGHWRACL